MQKLYSKKNSRREKEKERIEEEPNTNGRRSRTDPTERFEIVPEQPTRSLIWVG